MKLETYKARLKAHDWFYGMSDNHKIYCKGEREEGELVEIAAKEGAEFMRAFNEEYAKHFPERGGYFTFFED